MPYAIRLMSAVCCFFVALIFSAPAEARRVALVIGNSAYKVGPLVNPANDAAAVAMTLQTQLKFDKVILKQNLGSSVFRDVLSQFSSEAMGADIALIYFAGHGIEASGVNFLLPVDATLRRASDLNLQAIALPTVLEQLDGVRTLRLVILDACRDNPFPLPGAKRTVKRGLTRIEPAGNTLVLYAAKDGTTADDGIGRRHSPFTEALLKHIATPRLEVRVLVGRVRDEVMTATGSTQVPHTYGTLGGKEVYLRKDALAAPVPELNLPPPPPVVEKDKVPSPTPPPVAQKDKAPSPTPPPVAQKDKAPSPTPPPVVLKDKAPSKPAGTQFDKVAAYVRPAVVSIRTVKPKADAKSPGDKQSTKIPDGLEDFFQRFDKASGDKQLTKVPEELEASGLLISPDGYVVTAFHAVIGATSIQVHVEGKGAHKADVAAVDERSDIALLKIQQQGRWPFVALSASDAKVGEQVFAIASASGPGGAAIKGHVKGTDSEILGTPYGFIQTDVGFPKDGFAGSPLFDTRGSVLGIVTSKLVSEPIWFALPARDVHAVVEQLKVYGTVKRGWLGVRIQKIDADMAASLGLSEPKGALVAEVQSPSPASIAGIKRGDTILAVNGVKIADSRHLSRQIAGFKPDTTVELKLMRALKEQTVQVKLGSLLPLATSKPPEAPTPGMWFSQLGLSVKVDRGVAKEGVVVAEVESASVVAQKLKVGDVILEANNRPVNSAEDLIAAIRDVNRQNRTAILLLIKSGGETRFELVPLRRSN